MPPVPVISMDDSLGTSLQSPATRLSHVVQTVTIPTGNQDANRDERAVPSLPTANINDNVEISPEKSVGKAQGDGGNGDTESDDVAPATENAT